MKALSNIMLAVTVFVSLTRADGDPLYVVPDNITEVTTPFAGACPKNARSFVRTFSSTYCVLESVDDVVGKFRDAGQPEKAGKK